MAQKSKDQKSKLPSHMGKPFPRKKTRAERRKAEREKAKKANE